MKKCQMPSEPPGGYSADGRPLWDKPGEHNQILTPDEIRRGDVLAICRSHQEMRMKIFVLTAPKTHFSYATEDDPEKPWWHIDIEYLADCAVVPYRAGKWNLSNYLLRQGKLTEDELAALLEAAQLS